MKRIKWQEISNECRYCQSTEALTIDHIIPKAVGGQDVLENFQVLCRHCNSIKHNMTEKELKEWLLGFISKYEKRLEKARFIITRI